MEAYYDLVRRLLKGFEGAGVDYVFTGALAASYYGAPRTTVDVDVVVAVAEAKQKARLVEALGRAGLVVDERVIDRALESGYRIATFKDSRTAYSVDVIFSEGKLEKRAGTVAGLQCFYQTPEELILAKLRMIKATKPRERAVKDEEDIKAILKFTKVDVEAIKREARKDNTLEIFKNLTATEDDL
ncbi:MAG: hypothetical protein QHH18_07490 [Candidatus Bathyarchaeota archaeon]|nr:hypothetical protein [Candidatus Bathyarchaeota archaeon A05DMB-5]MDH7558425.1 hypothetical protein [Candidatus Bathyarchaeota archaeon]